MPAPERYGRSFVSALRSDRPLLGLGRAKPKILQVRPKCIRINGHVDRANPKSFASRKLGIQRSHACRACRNARAANFKANLVKALLWSELGDEGLRKEINVADVFEGRPSGGTECEYFKGCFKDLIPVWP